MEEEEKDTEARLILESIKDDCYNQSRRSDLILDELINIIRYQDKKIEILAKSLHRLKLEITIPE